MHVYLQHPDAGAQAPRFLRLSLQPAPPFEPTVSRARVDDFLKWLE